MARLVWACRKATATQIITLYNCGAQENTWKECTSHQTLRQMFYSRRTAEDHVRFHSYQLRTESWVLTSTGQMENHSLVWWISDTDGKVHLNPRILSCLVSTVQAGGGGDAKKTTTFTANYMGVPKKPKKNHECMVRKVNPGHKYSNHHQSNPTGE